MGHAYEIFPPPADLRVRDTCLIKQSTVVVRKTGSKGISCPDAIPATNRRTTIIVLQRVALWGRLLASVSTSGCRVVNTGHSIRGPYSPPLPQFGIVGYEQSNLAQWVGIDPHDIGPADGIAWGSRAAVSKNSAPHPVTAGDRGPEVQRFPRVDSLTVRGSATQPWEGVKR